MKNNTLNSIKVSIILPIYNVQEYIEECLDSILRQTHKNLEIILVDDGSPDSCGNIIDRYAKNDHRIKTIHKENGGVSSARNAGLRIAEGEYICFADPDDYLSDDYVEYLLSLAYFNCCDVSISKGPYINCNGSKKDEIFIKNNVDISYEMLLHKIPIGVYCKLFKSDFLRKNHIKFNQDLYIGEGFNFNMKAFQLANKIAVGFKSIYFYRTNEKSAVNLFNIKKWENALYSLSVIEKELIVSDKKIFYAMNFAKWYDGCFILRRLIKNSVYNDYPEMVSKCKQLIRQNTRFVFFVKTSLKNKIKALFLFISPRITIIGLMR